MLWLNLGNCVQLLVGCEFNDNQATILRTTGGRYRVGTGENREISLGKENKIVWMGGSGWEGKKKEGCGREYRESQLKLRDI